MMTFEQIKHNLDILTNPVERLEMVMDLGQQLDSVPINAKCCDIVGCASRVQICRQGNRFYAVADSALVRGIVAILISMVDGHSVTEIKNMDLDTMFRGLDLSLGAGRINGVNSMIRFFKNL